MGEELGSLAMTEPGAPGKAQRMPAVTSGVLNIDKPAGWTSHDVVARVRRLTGVRRVGHAGTLDPMATGVLVVCLGRATRLIEYLMGQPKTYWAEITLGQTTDTYDATGQVTAELPVPPLDRAALEKALNAFRGEIMQRPPAFAAIKRNGEPLYKRARRGETVEVEPRPITIYELQLLGIQENKLRLQVTCSAGTYVRSLAHDLGQALGCGAHLSGLRRLAVGHFTIDQAVPLARLENKAWTEFVLPPDAAVAHLEKVILTQQEAVRLLHGQAIPGRQPGSRQPMRAYDPTGRLLGIVRFNPQRQAWQPLKVLAQ